VRAGQQAPDFEAIDLYGRPVALRMFAGRRVLLAFHRAANCPLCSLRLWQLIQQYPALQAQGVSVIAFFESAPEYAHLYLDRIRPPFPLIADLGRVVYDLYGLETSYMGALVARLKRGAAYREAKRLHLGGHPWLNPLTMDGHVGRLPADFLLDPDLRVRLAYYGRDAGDFLLFSEIRELLASPARGGMR
jgi:peroxiredoxin